MYLSRDLPRLIELTLKLHFLQHDTIAYVHVRERCLPLPIQRKGRYFFLGISYVFIE